jgi:hypothetical protein
VLAENRGDRVAWQQEYGFVAWCADGQAADVMCWHRAVQGVTHVSQMTQYPADVSTDTPALWVAHFAHPIEVEWVARTAPTPKDWPRLLLQVRNKDQGH